MRIGLHDAEQEYMKHKTFPNYALMKISAYHKARGDSVEWWSPMCHYDRVYSSKVFDFTPENLYLPLDAIRGGTGYDDIPLNQKLPPEIDAAFPDYSIYPECDYAIGYLTRGCPNHCPWCVVPEKEGGIKPYHLHNWNPEDDERMMMAIYHSEQVHPFPRYKNALEQFKADWAAGTYDPGATLCFQPEDVEEIEVLCEEIVPEPQTATPPPRTPKKKRRKRRRK